MSEDKQPAPKRSGGKEQLDQVKQIAILAGIVFVCAGLITWTVMLMRDRLAERHTINEQSSSVDVREQSGTAGESAAETTATNTEYSGFQVSDTTTSTTTTDDTTSSATTTATNATAPPKVTVQSAYFSKVSTTATTHTGHNNTQTTTSKHSTAKTATDATDTSTTHTETVTVPPEDAPEGAQITYNQLLALYLGAEEAGGSAYFVDAHGDSAPMVILHGGQSYYAVSAEDAFSLHNRFGGTGDSAENPWQTGSAFRFYQYDGTNRCIYYTSQGENYQIIGYYDAATGENIWARLHYYQIGVSWQAEYHIIYSSHSGAANGTQTEVASGTCDTNEMYAITTEFEQALEKELLNRGISAGNWSDYEEIKPNSQSDINALWSKAGSYNSGFKPQSGGTYGAVIAAGGTALKDAAGGNVIAELPAGTLLSISTASLPVGNAPVEVEVLISGKWLKGYVDGSAVLAWSEN